MNRKKSSKHLRPRPASLCAAHSLMATAVLVGASLAAAPSSVSAQSAGAPNVTLRQAFEAAWARQPESAALATRRDAVRAQQQSASAWSSAPLSLEVLNKTDALSRNQGSREFELGVAVPLWLPGERGRSQTLADAEGRALESRLKAAQLRVAGAVREAWWSWHRARAEMDVALAQQSGAIRLAADVAKRLKAGDLARADMHQADGAVAAADAAVAQAEAAAIATRLHLESITALNRALQANAQAEADAAIQASLDAHPELMSVEDKLAVADNSAALTATQSRANPELTVATTRGRGAFGEPYSQTLTVGIRVPFGGGPRFDARTATARADTLELQSQLVLERARLGASNWWRRSGARHWLASRADSSISLFSWAKPICPRACALRLKLLRHSARRRAPELNWRPRSRRSSKRLACCRSDGPRHPTTNKTLRNFSS
jgi:outer membrane protein, heavy metal efflux system